MLHVHFLTWQPGDPYLRILPLIKQMWVGTNLKTHTKAYTAEATRLSFP